MKICLAGKGGVGKTALAVALARELAVRGLRVLAVDCDPNPNLAESFGRDSRELDRFSRDGLQRSGETLELAREPVLIEVEHRLSLLGGPPSDTPLADAVARGIAGVLIADRYGAVVTDLGPGPEFTRTAVGGLLNPADLCIVVSDGSPTADVTAERIDAVCSDRRVNSMRVKPPSERLPEWGAALASQLLQQDVRTHTA